MKKSLLTTALLILSAAAIVLAQGTPEAARYDAQVKGKGCDKTFTWTSSTAAPSAALVSYVQTKYKVKLVGYNAPGCNVFWGDSVPLSGGIIGAINSKECGLCDGKIEIAVKPCGRDLPQNDDYAVRIGGTQIATGRIWASTPTAKTLVIPIPAAKLRAALCNTHGQPPTIDVFVEDDATVSSMKVTLKY